MRKFRVDEAERAPWPEGYGNTKQSSEPINDSGKAKPEQVDLPAPSELHAAPSRPTGGAAESDRAR